MPNPRLLHPVPIFLRQIDRRRTAIMDDNLHEPVGQVRRELKPVKLSAQMKIFDTDRARAASGGATEDSTGYALFRTSDLNIAKIEIERGDRIVQIGDGKNGREVDYYIVKVLWLGHYQFAQGPTLVKAFFEDRKPSRQRGDL